MQKSSPLKLVKLHNTELVNSGTLQVNLDLTSLPEDGLTGNCWLSLTLDPFQKCPDENRENNILEFAFKMNGSNFDVDKSACQVFSDYSSNGKNCFGDHS